MQNSAEESQEELRARIGDLSPSERALAGRMRPLRRVLFYLIGQIILATGLTLSTKDRSKKRNAEGSG